MGGMDFAAHRPESGRLTTSVSATLAEFSTLSLARGKSRRGPFEGARYRHGTADEQPKVADGTRRRLERIEVEETRCIAQLVPNRSADRMAEAHSGGALCRPT